MSLTNSPSSESLPNIASIETSSVAEDERRQILAGILAEEDDDSISVGGFDNAAGGSITATVSDAAGDNDIENSARKYTAGKQLPQKLLTARKRIESENAFSSSSEDEFDETDLEGIYGAAHLRQQQHQEQDKGSYELHAEQRQHTDGEIDINAQQEDTVDFTLTQSASHEKEFRNNALTAISQSIDNANRLDESPRRMQQSSLDKTMAEDAAELTTSAFSFESTAAKVAAAAARMAAPKDEDEVGQQPTKIVEDEDDYLVQAEHQVLDEILNNDEEKEDNSSQPPTTARPTSQNISKIRNKPILQANFRPNSLNETAPKQTNGSMMTMLDASTTLHTYYKNEEERESMRRAFQQCISAAVLVSLAHKRYERRRLAAMEIEKVVRSLVSAEDYTSVRAVLLLLSDDYVRSTNEDARKGGVVALAACAIGLKKATVGREVMECRDLILASVVHACQDHSQRVRYYATESLFNVCKVIPSLAVQHFFILFEILRSLYADVDLDVRSGAELLDKKLKEVIVGAINSGSFSADACVPVFARFVYMRNKATRQLTLTWLQEFSEKLIGAPILEFLHLFLGGIFAMVSDPNVTIRQLALDFLQLVLPKLLVNNEDFEDTQHMAIDFDKILQSLVLTMEHPDPFVRKVAMYWMSRIIQAHISSAFSKRDEIMGVESVKGSRGIDISISGPDGERPINTHLTAASISVRNALPHVLPGILLSIGDTHQSRAKDSFLPDQTTHSLAEQANSCLQDAVRRDGQAFIPHLGGFIVALRDELDSPGGLIARNPPSVERRPYRMDVKPDGSGIESTGWYRASDGVEERDNALILSRLCALQWIVVLYDYVVPNSLKAEYASEFVDCVIYQLVDQPPGIITVKSFEVLAKISIPSEGETPQSVFAPTLSMQDNAVNVKIPSMSNPMDDESVNFALGVLEVSRRKVISRDRNVFASLIDLHSKHPKLLVDVSKVIELMCTLQPPEFVFVAFANELDNFVVSRMEHRERVLGSHNTDAQAAKNELSSFAKDLAFVSNFAQQLGIVLFAAPEAEQLRDILKDCIGCKGNSIRDERRARLYYILLHAFSHNIVAALSLCLWGGAFLTASSFLKRIDPLDVSLMFYLEIDQLIDLIERPIFRHLQLRLLECEDEPYCEGSGAMLFLTLKRIMMLLPQSTSYMILQERLSSVARYRQSAVSLNKAPSPVKVGSWTDIFVKRIIKARRLHVWMKWRMIRAESLEEEPCRILTDEQKFNAQQQRRDWLGYKDEEDERSTKQKIKEKMLGSTGRAEIVGVYEGLNEVEQSKNMQYYEDEETKNDDGCKLCTGDSQSKEDASKQQFERKSSSNIGSQPQWREFWANPFSLYALQSTRSLTHQPCITSAATRLSATRKEQHQNNINKQPRRDFLSKPVIVTSCILSAQSAAATIPLESPIEGLGGTKERIQGIGGGFDILAPDTSKLTSFDAYYPSSMINTRWKVQRVVTSVEGDTGQAAIIWSLLGGSTDKAFTSQLTEVYEAYFVEASKSANDSMYQFDGKTVNASVLDRRTTLASRMGIDSSSVLWERDAPQTLQYTRRTNKSDAVELSTLQRKNELSEAGFGSDELLKLTSTSFGGTIDRVCRVKSRYRRGFDEASSKRIIDGLEIVTTYRVLDGVAGVEMPTSTCKSRIRLTEM